MWLRSKVMKPQEAELVTEISKLQCMVSELKTGFTSALLELSQIQHGDTFLREELEENRRSCQKKALRLETLVESLREELGVMRCQILQLYSNRQRPQQDAKSSARKQKESDPTEPDTGRRQCECPSAPAACLSRGKLLLHCFLQGLKAGLSEGTDARHQVAMQLLHSEWEYVSTLNQLYDRYKTPPAHQMTVEPYQTYMKFVEQLLQRHLLFRNTLQERLSAEHWKSLVGDILVQLIGQNDTAFSDMYVGYATTLASFLSLEFNRLNQPEKSHKVQLFQSGQMEREEMKLLTLLLAPVSRVHSYLSHIQNLLQWTGKEHPDCSLLLGTERALRSILSRCHVILEEDVRWEEGDGQSCPDAAAGGSSTRSQQTGECRPCREEGHCAAQRDDQQPVALTNGLDAHHSMRVECWSCSPVRRKGCERDRTFLKQPAHDCGHAYCSVLTPDAAGWGENSDSGQGTYSQPTGKGTTEMEGPHGNHNLEDCETDADDTSAFDYSSVTSCSPDGTLRREMMDSNSGEDEEDSQVPVLLKPSHSQQQQAKERTVCLRWQIPRLTPHPPLRNPAGLCVNEPKPCLISSYGKRLVSVRKGSPPLHPKSAFRPIWDDPSKQADSAPEKDSRQGFIPIQAAARQSFQNFNSSRENLRPGLSQQRGNPAAAMSGGGLWDDSEDSEGPCSTV
ncbi:hypothetical protein Q5P01_020821 [Channa striata]|uniref:DH domain-containing protein n=1 Tax=Channa striata TaxID=64152 RepID=A0AA88LYF0_CHASR|nr:hypothetical protein Q5P01_020821 [Channa striata]